MLDTLGLESEELGEKKTVETSVQNSHQPASNLLLSLRMGSYIFVDASPGACNISEAIFFCKIRVNRGIFTRFVFFSFSFWW